MFLDKSIQVFVTRGSAEGQRGDGQRTGNGPHRVAEEDDWRMNQHGRVLKLDLAGATLLEIGAPDDPIYRDKPFQPTGLR